jgi:hypothetical protein
MNKETINHVIALVEQKEPTLASRWPILAKLHACKGSLTEDERDLIDAFNNRSAVYPFMNLAAQVPMVLADQIVENWKLKKRVTMYERVEPWIHRTERASEQIVDRFEAMDVTELRTVDGAARLAAYLSENNLENASVRPAIIGLVQSWEETIMGGPAGPDPGVDQILVDI